MGRINGPAFPELFRGTWTRYVFEPYLLEGVKAWQQCYVCGFAVTFKTDKGKWLSIGDGRIRHNKCEPPALKG